MMINTKSYYLYFFLMAFAFCLFASSGKAQSMDALYSSNHNTESLFIEKNTNMEQALELMEERFNILFIYRSKIIKDSRVKNEIVLTNGIENTLDKLFEGTDLEYANLKHKTYGIYTRKEDNPESLNLPIFQETVTGTVVDAESGESLPGVNIVLKGTSTGATSDLDGNFELSLSSLDGILVFSYIGYQPQEISIDGQTEFNVSLEPATIMGGEAVVTAFGIARERASLGYSVSELKTESLTQARDINVASSLSGRIAGVNASGMGTGPGSSSRVIIRGAGSLDGNNQPLYVLNGMPITNDARTIGTTGGSQVDRGDGISNINPDDIESISVLKGGAAAALYGSQAANGVVLITTKSGTQNNDGIGVEFNSNYMVGTINVFPDYQTEFGQGIGGVRPQDQGEAHNTGRLTFGERHDGQPTVNFDGVERPYSYISVKDNMKEFYRPSTTATNSIAFSGALQGIIYRLSLSNLDGESIQPNSGYSRQTVNLNIQSKLSEKLSVQSSIQYNFENGKNRPGHNYAPENVNWAVTLLANTVPIEALAPGYDPETGREVEWQSVNVAHNPYFTVNKIENQDSRNRILAQGKITYNILPNLYAQGDIMRDFEMWEAVNFVPVGTSFTPNGNYRSFNENKARTNIRTILGYDTSITENFHVSTMVGGNIERVDNDSYSLTGVDYIIPDWISPSNLQTTSAGRGALTSGTNSLFASADFNYREIAYLNLTGREDWFSTLDAGNNNIFYPSIGGSLVLSRAIQMPDVISYARIRASWAEVGGATVNPYAINQTYSYQEGGHLGVPVQTSSSVLANPNLRPLTSRTYEAGFDLELWDSRLAFDVTVYNRLNENDMITTQLANSSGASSTILNAGEIRNRGIELLVNAEPIRTNDFSWNVSYNVGYNKNEVLSLAPGQAAGGTSLLGRDLSTTFAYDVARTADGTVIYNSQSNYEMRGPVEAVGPGVPPTTMGFENTLNFRDLSMNILFDGKFGNHYFSRHAQYIYRFGHAKETLPGRENGINLVGVDENGNPFEHHWGPELMHVYYNNSGINYTKQHVQDGSFVKLRSLIISYNLPVEKLGFLGNLQSAQISLVGKNLAILYKKTDHFDPEQSYDPNSNTQNFAGTQLPRTREIGVNLKVRF